jgi:hypothetical protein
MYIHFVGLSAGEVNFNCSECHLRYLVRLFLSSKILGAFVFVI